MKYWLSFGLVVLKLTTVDAAEVDQFTQLTGLDDSSEIIAQEVNRRMRLAVDKANSAFPRPLQHKKIHHIKRPQCDINRLYGQLQYQLARPLVGQLESFAEQSPQVDRRRVSFSDSIYQDYLPKEAPTLVLSERIAAVIKVNGVEIGSDKLGHFFTEGHSYFEVTNRLREGTEFGFLFGDWSESLYYGAQTTGVFSYADLTANFNGLRFWNRILANQPDPLNQQTVIPYIRCENRRWVVNNPFDFDGYIDSGWNEAVNCSAFRTAQLLQKVMNHQAVCRVEQLPKRYATIGHDIINHEGLKVLPENLQPEVILERRTIDLPWKLPEQAKERIKEIRLDLEQWRSRAE
ncbi:MAG: hypothetical protein MK185_16510 [Saccharospirillaceae bacterium]|nr:hypothetical protein [Saccharospirillaceae bacterium]